LSTELDLLKLYFAQHWINHTETMQTIPLGSVEQENKKCCLWSVKLKFTVKELTRLLSIREVPSLELLGQIIRFCEDRRLPGSGV
jgi:hypothetical protein